MSTPSYKIEGIPASYIDPAGRVVERMIQPGFLGKPPQWLDVAVGPDITEILGIDGAPPEEVTVTHWQYRLGHVQRKDDEIVRVFYYR